MSIYAHMILLGPRTDNHEQHHAMKGLRLGQMIYLSFSPSLSLYIYIYAFIYIYIYIRIDIQPHSYTYNCTGG